MAHFFRISRFQQERSAPWQARNPMDCAIRSRLSRNSEPYQARVDDLYLALRLTHALPAIPSASASAGGRVKAQQKSGKPLPAITLSRIACTELAPFALPLWT